MTPIAVCLLTCGREAYTARTLESFLAQNPDRSRFILLHGDDASSEKTNVRLAKRAGFLTVVRHKRRQGNVLLRTALIKTAMVAAPWTLILENDIESIRPFPWPLFDFVRTQKAIGCLRLFGAFKGPRQTDPCRTLDKWSKTEVRWAPLVNAPEPAELARIHWSAQPSVTKSKALAGLHFHDHRDVGLTARVVQNAMVHIGVERTQPMARAS